ncbi:MAG: gamma-glutamyltranspeptidase/glutathione hydrolase [Desulforhopalus sp.]|jgi:gamma-glutamyltranspeptidase/glutathione hydrolase
MYDKSIVASGHNLVSDAAAEILQSGGNGFDAVVAAGFASAVVEPALTSLGGGGLLVGHSQRERRNIFYDFFVDTPGRGSKNDGGKSDFFPVQIDFSGSSQEFNVGLGSVAVPGVLKGLLHTHRKQGIMPLADVVRPARELAAGHVLNKQQGYFLSLLYPILTLTKRSQAMYQLDGRCLQTGDVLKNLQMVEFLDRLVVEGDDCFYLGDIADKIDREMRENGGLLTKEDLAAFTVKERAPLSVPYRGRTLVTVAEPSMGGTLIGLSLILQDQLRSETTEWGSARFLSESVGIMREVERLRSFGITDPESLERFLGNGEQLETSASQARLFSRGTTHVSVADSEGNCASMTCSNGEGSGYIAPGTGVMLNNMMGEDDLHPNGFHSSPSGERVLSMMSPSLLMGGDTVELVIGSGGSKRIRTAISHVISQVVDFDRSLQDAVDAPRLYLDEEVLQIEPGYNQSAIDAAGKLLPVNVWSQKDVYFGGVHAVIPGKEGAGDPRRGGAVRVVG